MWFKVAAIAVLCVTDAVAQAPMVMQNCTTQVGNDMFRYCFDTPGLMPPTRVFWNPAAGTPPTIAFAFEAMGVGQPVTPVWRAVGFSNGPPEPMINNGGDAANGGSNVVLGCIPPANSAQARGFLANDATAGFLLQQKAGAGVNPSLNLGLAGYSQDITGPVCSIRFTRPVTLAAFPDQSLGDRDQVVIVARGMDGDAGLANHGPGTPDIPNRIGFPMNFVNPANLVAPGDPGMTTMTTMAGQTDAPAGNDASKLGASITLLPAVVGSIYAALW